MIDLSGAAAGSISAAPNSRSNQDHPRPTKILDKQGPSYHYPNNHLVSAGLNRLGL
jgi:hypothetical protein